MRISTHSTIYRVFSLQNVLTNTPTWLTIDGIQVYTHEIGCRALHFIGWEFGIWSPSSLLEGLALLAAISSITFWRLTPGIMSLSSISSPTQGSERICAGPCNYMEID